MSRECLAKFYQFNFFNEILRIYDVKCLGKMSISRNIKILLATKIVSMATRILARIS